MKTLLILLIAVSCVFQSVAQIRVSPDNHKGVLTIKGDYYFEHNNYAAAISNYSKSVSKNPKDIHAMLRMAEAYQKSGDDNMAAQWYSKAFSAKPDVDETHVLKYISVLHKLEKYDALPYWTKIYNEKVNNRNLTDDVHKTYNDSTLVIIHNLHPVNSTKSDLGPVLHNDQLIFLSNRTSGDTAGYNLYRAVVNQKGQYEQPASFHEEMNSTTSNGPIAIAQKQNRLFLTRAVPSQRDKKKLSEISYYEIPVNRSDKVKTDKLVIRNSDNGILHPAVNSEGTLMFFTSKNPKNERGYDLYRSEYNGKSWSAPHALGSTINTSGDEMYPVLYNDSILYFASNGNSGLGGFDIYKVNIHARHARVEHLPDPINSPSDDFGIVFSNNGREGYLVSNRPGGSGDNDLYKLYSLPVKTKKHVSETSAENLPEPEALSIYTSTGNEIRLTHHKNKGNLAFEFIPGMSYSLIMDYENYKTGPIKTNSNKTALPKRNAYTFHIQKLSSTYNRSDKGAVVSDVHINPGDLVTFQLVPNGKAADAESSNSKLHFNNDEATIKLGDTLIFSYVAEADPDALEIDDTASLANINAEKEEHLSSDNTLADTVSPTESITEKDTPPGNQAPEAGITPPPVLSNTTALQNKETIRQNQPDPEEKNIDVVTASKNTIETAPENNPNAIVLASDGNHLSDPADKNNIVASKVTEENSSLLPSASATPLDSKSIESDPLAGTIKNVDANTLNKNATETEQQNSQKDIVMVPDDSQLSDPGDKINAVTSESTEQNTSLSTSASTIASDNKESTEQNPLVSTTQDVGAGAASKKDVEVTTIAQHSLTSRIAPIGITENATEPASLSSGIEYHAGNTPANDDFEYRVQIAAARSALSDVQLKKIYNGPKEIRFFQEDGYYKYTIEETPSYLQARQALKESGVNHAFISAYKSDKKWDLKEAIAIQNKNLTPQTQPKAADGNNDQTLMAGRPEGNILKNKPDATDLSASAVETVDGKENPDHLIADSSLRGKDEVAAKENISIVGNNQPGIAYHTDTILTEKGTQSVASLDGNNEKDKQEKDGTELPSTTTTTLTLETTETSTLASIDDDIVIDPNPNKADQQAKSEINNSSSVGHMPANPVKENIVASKDNTGDPLQLDSENTITLQAAASTEQSQPDNKNKVGNGTFSETTAETESPLLSIDPDNSVPGGNVDIEYRLQIAASRSALSNAQLKKIYQGPKEIYHFKEEGYHKYVIAKTPLYQEAQQALKESGVTEAFISVYKENAKWNLKEAIAFQHRDSNKQNILPSPAGERNAADVLTSDGFQYRVQIAASRRKIKDAQLKKEYDGPGKVRFFKEDGYYKYYIGETSNYYVARQILKKSSVDSAFISAYKGETKWRLQDAIALQYKTPLIQSELAAEDSIVKIVTVNFELDEFELLPDETSHLRANVVDLLKTNQAHHAIVNGYTDIRGSEAYNFGLSQERAHFVEQLIVREGIDSERVTTQYFGESQVIKYCPENERCDESVHQVNRRVEILLLVKKNNFRDISSLSNRNR